MKFSEPKKKPVYFEDVANRSLRLIDGTLADLEAIREARTERGDEEDAGIDMAGLAALEKTTRALSGLLAQLRQIGRDNNERMGKLGPSERQALMLDYFSGLPEEQMHSYLVDFQAMYDERRIRHLDSEIVRASDRIPKFT